MDTEGFIWITDWRRFQHYKPDRESAPKWIKSATRQLHDDNYQDLTVGERLALHELRLMFASARGQVRVDLPRISRQLGHRVTRAQLDSLNHAGFIQVVSREVLDQNLEEFYSRSRAEQEQDVDVEEQEQEPLGSNGHAGDLPIELEMLIIESGAVGSPGSVAAIREAADGVSEFAISRARDTIRRPGVRNPVGKAIATLNAIRREAQ